MPSRTAKIVSAVVVSFLAGVAFTSLSHSPAGAADECLSAPNDQAPQGSHWYYRVDRATNRQCWYLRDQAEKASQQAAQPSQQAAQPDPWQSARQPSPKAETAPRRPAAEARAELTPRTNVEQLNQAGPTAARSPGAAVNTVDRGTNAPVAETQPSSVADAATDVTAASPAQSTPSLNTSRFSPADAPAEAPPPPTHSVQNLLAAILGALALAGVMGRVIFKFVGTRRPARRRGRRRRGAIWKSAPKGRRVAAAPLRRVHVPRDLDQVSASDDKIAELAEFFAERQQRSRRAPG
jgi:hypothetical protein